jgi:DNA (cytosine-5)-methyltransferase 1
MKGLTMPKDDATLSAASAGSAMRYASVCDGIGAAHVAWQPLGWQCQWTSEIEPFPAAVVDHHWKLKNLGDMTKLTEEMLNECGPISLLCGGTPCQSFSVAGLRKGLEDPRGNLALRFTQLVGVLRPEWVVWENVPGVLSSGEGRDFGTFLGALAELGYGFAYRILDAQWFGVAQRRRRVFVVANARGWQRAAAVLFERESLFGNPPTRGTERERTSTAAALSTKGGRKDRGEASDSLVPVGFKENMSTPDAAVGLGTTLQAENFHAVATPFTKAKRAQSDTDDESWVPGDVAPTQSCFDQGDVRATTVVAYDVHGTLATKAASETQIHSALRGRTPGQSEASTTTVVAQGFTYSGYSNQPAWMTGDRTDCLPSSGHSDGSHQGIGVTVPPVQVQWASGGGQTENPTMQALRANVEYNYQFLRQAMAVRRLTPRECERLQGFPDDYTLVEYRKKPAADGPRYRALGNSMAVPVMRWIGERIQQIDRL